ncbi:MAG: mycofactocin-coupled SDR family oxidoreductase [Acidimicrobiales bacterium]
MSRPDGRPAPAGRVAGTVALVTGAARGQGRSHALRLAIEGADIIAIDRCGDIDGLDYPLGTAEDLEETAELVAATGALVVHAVADVRDAVRLAEAVSEGVARLGRLDSVVVNAGVCAVRRWDEVTPALWDTVIGVNLTGAWNTCTATIPHLLASGGGSIVLIGSTASVKGQPFFAPYVASKHGLVGIMRTLANELACHRVRVNGVLPTGVDTPMLMGMERLGRCIEERPDLGPVFLNALPIDVIAPEEVSDAVLYLVSAESRSVTGLALNVDAGSTLR